MSIQVEVAVNIAAPPEQVWKVLMDVRRWPQWTPSVNGIEYVSSGPLALGTRARIRQPRMPAKIWTVTEFEPDRAFTWETQSLGVKTVAGHRLSVGWNRTAHVELYVLQTGFLVPVFRRWTEKLTREYVDMEAQGLKARCENASVAA